MGSRKGRLCRVPHIVSLCVVFPCIIHSAVRGIREERSSNVARLFEAVVGHVLIVSFLCDTYNGRLQSPLFGAGYTAAVAGLLLHVAWMGDRTGSAEYKALGVGVTLYALYHVSSLSGDLSSVNSMLPRHPLRRFCPCSIG